MILLIASVELTAFEMFASTENDKNGDSDQFSEDEFYNVMNWVIALILSN